MKFLVLTFFAVLVAVYANEEECEKRAENCVQQLLNAMMSESSEDACKELGTSVACMKSVVEDCLGSETEEVTDEDVQEIRDGIKQLEELLRDNCGESQGDDDEDDEDAEIARCFEENEEYFMACIEEGGVNLFAILEKNGNMDENSIECLYYKLTASCFVEKMKEKCGEKGSRMLREEMKALPDDIEEACSIAERIDIADVELQLLDKKK